MIGISIISGAVLLALGSIAMAQEGPRFKPLAPQEMTEAQRKVYQEIAGGPRGRGLSEFAILITARYWGSQYEWFAHAPLAAKGGSSSSVIADL